MIEKRGPLNFLFLLLIIRPTVFGETKRNEQLEYTKHAECYDMGYGELDSVDIGNVYLSTISISLY